MAREYVGTLLCDALLVPDVSGVADSEPLLLAESLSKADDDGESVGPLEVDALVEADDAPVDVGDASAEALARLERDAEPVRVGDTVGEPDEGADTEERSDDELASDGDAVAELKREPLASAVGDTLAFGESVASGEDDRTADADAALDGDTVVRPVAVVFKDPDAAALVLGHAVADGLCCPERDATATLTRLSIPTTRARGLRLAGMGSTARTRSAAQRRLQTRSPTRTKSRRSRRTRTSTETPRATLTRGSSARRS